MTCQWTRMDARHRMKAGVMTQCLCAYSWWWWR